MWQRIDLLFGDEIHLQAVAADVTLCTQPALRPQTYELRLTTIYIKKFQLEILVRCFTWQKLLSSCTKEHSNSILGVVARPSLPLE